MELFLGILLGLLVLVVLVVLHELGHAIVAKRNGVVVEEFGIGFPPRGWSRKLKNGVLFSLNWLPLGGFVKLKGEYDSAKGKGTYGQASYWVKTKILLAGVAINWITAALLFAVISLWGLPKILPDQVVLPFDNTVVTSPLLVSTVGTDSPAENAGLKVGDEILSIGDTPVITSSELSSATKSQAGKEVIVEYRRGKETRKSVVQLNSASEAKNGGYLGVGSSQTESIRATWSAPVLGVATAGQLTYATISSIGDMLVKGIGGFFGQFSATESTREQAQQNLGALSQSVAGPVGILGVIFPSVLDAGVTQILLLCAIISLTLAVMNLLPIPALDGGRWTAMTLFRIFKKDLTKEREETIQSIGFLAIMLLTILVTWSDVSKLFG